MPSSMNSLRAKGVMSVHAANVVALAISAARRKSATPAAVKGGWRPFARAGSLGWPG